MPLKKAKKKKDKGLSLDLLKTLQQELRDLDLSWVEKLVNQVKEDDTLPKDDQKFQAEITERKVYNVFSGIVRDNGWKVFIYGQGRKLKATLLKKVADVIE